MITIRTNPAATATPVKTYDKRIRARDAAVAAIGPHARDGFEFTLDKVDGRWIWKATEEVRPMTPAQLKMNGGKRAEFAPSPLKEAVAAAVAQDMSAKQFRKAAEKVADELLAKGTPADQGIAAAKADDSARKASAAVESVTEVIVATKGQAKVVKDPDHKNMFLVRYADGTVSGSLNLTRANQLAKVENDGDIPHADERDADEVTVAAPKSQRKSLAKGKPVAKKTAQGSSVPVSKTALVGQLLSRSEGCTTADILAATGWPSVSVPQQARAVGMELRREKEGSVMRYYGIKQQ